MARFQTGYRWVNGCRRCLWHPGDCAERQWSRFNAGDAAMAAGDLCQLSLLVVAIAVASPCISLSSKNATCSVVDTHAPFFESVFFAPKCCLSVIKRCILNTSFNHHIREMSYVPIYASRQTGKQRSTPFHQRECSGGTALHHNTQRQAFSTTLRDGRHQTYYGFAE